MKYQGLYIVCLSVHFIILGIHFLFHFMKVLFPQTDWKRRQTQLALVPVWDALLWECSGSEVAGSRVRNSSGESKWPPVFWTRCADLHSRRQRMRVPTLRHLFSSTQYCPLFNFAPVSWVWHLFIPLLLSEVEHLCICLWGVCTSSVLFSFCPLPNSFSYWFIRFFIYSRY